MEKITLNFPSNQHIAHINGISQLVKLKTNKSPNNIELMAPNQPCSQLLIEKKVWLADALGSRWAAGISLGRSIVLVLFGILSASSFFKSTRPIYGSSRRLIAPSFMLIEIWFAK